MPPCAPAALPLHTTRHRHRIPHPTPCLLSPALASPLRQAVVDMETEFLNLGLDIIGLGVFNYDFGSITRESPVIKARRGGGGRGDRGQLRRRVGPGGRQACEDQNGAGPAFAAPPALVPGLCCCPACCLPSCACARLPARRTAPSSQGPLSPPTPLPWQAVYGVLKEAEHRSTFYIPYWNIPIAKYVVPRQVKFQRGEAGAGCASQALILKLGGAAAAPFPSTRGRQPGCAAGLTSSQGSRLRPA